MAVPRSCSVCGTLTADGYPHGQPSRHKWLCVACHEFRCRHECDALMDDVRSQHREPRLVSTDRGGVARLVGGANCLPLGDYQGPPVIEYPRPTPAGARPAGRPLTRRTDPVSEYTFHVYRPDNTRATVTVEADDYDAASLAVDEIVARDFPGATVEDA